MHGRETAPICLCGWRKPCSSWHHLTLQECPMNKFSAVLFAVLSLSLQVHANEIIDAWTITGGKVEQSVATKADGTQIVVPGEYAVTLRLENDRNAQPSVRQVMAKVDKNKILLTVETTEHSICGPQSSDGVLIDLGHDSAQTTVITGSGEFDVVINGFSVGKITIDGTNPIKLAKNAAYMEQINAELNRKLAEISGDVSKLVSAENGKSISVVMDQNGNFVVDYLIPAQDETMSNGDVLHKVERKDHLVLEYLDIDLGCDGNTGKAKGWLLSITDRSKENRLSIEKRDNSRNVSFIAKRQGETLSFQLAEKK
jgi:hypothetical protein